MKHTRLAATLAITALLCMCNSYADTGLTVLPAQGDFGPVTVFYPSSDIAKDVAQLEFTVHVAPEGQAVVGNHRLVVFSHGTGSQPWVTSDLAHHLVEAGFVVAVPEHRGDHRGDTSKVGPESWKLRPLEISHAIDVVTADPRFAPLVDADNVGMWGFSAGGHTALVLAGGQWSPARLRDHCEAHIAEDFAACTGGIVTLQNDWLDGIKKTVALWVIRGKMRDEQMQSYTDSRIKAIVAAAPWAANFDPQTLSHPSVPLGIVQVRQDAWLAAPFHSGAILRACASCEILADLPDAGHGTMLSPFPPQPPAQLLRLIGDPPAFDRAKEVPALMERTTRFFQQHLQTNP